MRVEQLMTRNVETCRPDESLHRAAELMWKRDCGALPVVTGEAGAEQVVGMLTDRDVCMAAYMRGRPLWEITVAGAMSRRVCSCRPTDAVGVALKIMETNQIRRLPVLDANDRLVGLLSLADVSREAAREHGQHDPQVTDAALAQALEAIAASRSSGALVARA
jgi:CBS-domain-containing membrane protein